MSPKHMTVDSTMRASSTLSSVPDIPDAPISMDSYAEKKLMSDKRVDARAKLTRDVNRLLQNDRIVFRDARKKAEKTWSTADLEPDVLEQKLVKAALDKSTARRAANMGTSAVYPAFREYISPAVYGKTSRGDVSDKEERQRLIELQLDMSCGVQTRAQLHEESDDEEPNPFMKKEEGGDELETKNSAHPDRSGATHRLRGTWTASEDLNQYYRLQGKAPQGQALRETPVSRSPTTMNTRPLLRLSLNPSSRVKTKKMTTTRGFHSSLSPAA
jgi:hypothetical protein